MTQDSRYNERRFQPKNWKVRCNSRIKELQSQRKSGKTVKFKSKHWEKIFSGQKLGMHGAFALHFFNYEDKEWIKPSHYFITQLCLKCQVWKITEKNKSFKKEKKKTLKRWVLTPEELVFQESYRKLNNDVVVRNMSVLLRLPTLLKKGNKVDACGSVSISW